MSPPHAKKTISAAAVFMNQYKKSRKDDATLRGKSSGSRDEVEDADGTTLLSFKQGVTEQRQSDMPLAMLSQEISNQYHEQLDETASLEIKKTLGDALKTVNERTLPATIPNGNQQNLNASPFISPTSAKYGRPVTKLHPPPISQFILSLRHTTSEGRVIRFQQTLEERMQNYKKLVVAQKEELATLQKEWETVVDEVWKLGTVCLGEETMKELLFTEPRFNGLSYYPCPLSSSPSRATDAESTLFVPEQDSSPLAKKSRPCKKHVTFLDEEMSEVNDEYTAAPTSEFPEFIYQGSDYQEEDFPTIPTLPEKEAKELNMRIEDLGSKEIEAFHKMNEDHQAFWEKKKNAQLAGVQKEN
ncbi:hypothetical protein Ptr902_04587 [Pyrenophora tritici-repentis]|nr:hypothetical protein Ptr902_04587 [Pyrenophora tritici-repentis]